MKICPKCTKRCKRKRPYCTKRKGDKMKIGIDLGGSHIAIGIVDKNGKIIEKNEKRLTKVEKRDIKNSVKEYIVEQVKQLKEKYTVKEIGIGMPGWDEDGKIVYSGNLGIKNYNLIEELQELELPIKIQNDAKCAALAEQVYGSLKGYDRAIFLTLGTGIGGAFFLNGQLLKAGSRPAYEFGHMVIEKEGIPCQCGRKGCFEWYASMKVFKNNLRESLQLDETTRGEELLEMLRRNSPENKEYELIEKVVCQYIEDLSTGIQNLISIFEPEVIGIGGSFVYFEDVLLDRLKKALQDINKKDEQRKNIKVVPAVLGNDAGIIGAVL